jgi:hypothetical protein
VDNIKIDLRETGWNGIDWTDLTQDRDQWRALMNMVMNLRVPQNAGKFSGDCTICGFSRRAQLHEVSYSDIMISFLTPRVVILVPSHTSYTS